MKTFIQILIVIAMSGLSTLANAGILEEIKPIQERWAEVNYHQSGDAQLENFIELEDEISTLIEQYPEMAEGYIWQGIIFSTHAGAKGGLGALALAKQAKKSLEKALELNPSALQGSAYASLGTLYYKVPGWPLGFGNKRKAEEYLQTALELEPESIDNNYFYAGFLFH